MSTDRHCVVCCEELGAKHVPAFGACNHHGVCSVCFLRMRAIVREFTCPVCKQELEHVVATNRNCTFQELQVWGEDIGPDYTYDHTSRMFFHNQYYTNFVSKLWLYDCQVCGRARKNLKELETHLKSDHDLHICHSCAKHKQVFPSEIKYYTQQNLDRHLRHGDPDEGGQGHPFCQFCKTRFYDKQTLFEHLHKDHYSCHLCEKKGIMYQYYRDYASLEAHFRSDHLLCEHSECLERRFVVFDSELELHAHIRTTHPDQKVPKAIPLNLTGFRYGRPSATEGKTEEPPIGEWTVEEFKSAAQDDDASGLGNQQAQGIESFTVSRDEFPELSPVGPIYSSNPRSYGNRPPVFDDNFPALGAAPPAAKARPTAAAVAAPRQSHPVPHSTTMTGAWARAAAQSRRGGRYRNQHISLAPRRTTNTTSFAQALAPSTSAAVAAHMAEDPWASRIIHEPQTAPKTDDSAAQGKKKSKGKKGKQAQAHPQEHEELKQPAVVQTAPTSASGSRESTPLPKPPGFDDDAFPLASAAAAPAPAQPTQQPKPVAKAKKAVRKPSSNGWSNALGSVGVPKPAKAGISIVKFKRNPDASTGASIEAGVQALRGNGSNGWVQSPASAPAASALVDSSEYPALPSAASSTPSSAAASAMSRSTGPSGAKKNKPKKQPDALRSAAFNMK